jgi:hypothetical protein
MAYRNVQQIAHRTLPMVRRELDKQLTVMVLIQVIVGCFTCLPFLVVNIFVLSPNILNDRVQIVYSIVLMLFCAYFAVSIHIIFRRKNYLYLWIRSISSSINLYTIQDSFQSIYTTKNN